MEYDEGYDYEGRATTVGVQGWRRRRWGDGVVIGTVVTTLRQISTTMAREPSCGCG